MVQKFLFKVVALLSLLLTACNTPVAEKKIETLAANTSLKTKDRPQPSDQLLVPSELVITAKTSRDLTELRSGPGSQFPLLNDILSKNELLILLAKHKKWNKVYIPSIDISAWLHQNQFRIERNLKTQLTISALTLPLVISYTNIDTIYDYRNKKPLNFPIPKGRGFRQLKKNDNMVLIYIPETHSVAWIKAKDIR